MLGAAGGALFSALHGGTAYTRAIAYGLWFAAALLLLAMPVVGSRGVYRRTSLPLLEGWVLGAAATVLTVLGVVVDVSGGT